VKRALVKRPQAPRLAAPVEILLGEIVAIDPCNARRLEPDADAVAELSAALSERGLLNPLIVRGSPGAWRVLAGGRRWRALKRIALPTDLVRVRVFDGDDESAAALSLDENIDRQDLHPLDEADRVAEMAQAARPETVARVLGRPERYVRRCVALSALPEVARAAWLSGRIGEPQARALAGSPASAVEALFANSQAAAILSDVRQIRAALTPRGVSVRAPAARFVGADAYVAAGGAMHEDLFGEEAWFLDADLLRRLERQKLSAEADRLCEAEGWGVQLFEPGDVGRAMPPDLTEPERAELADIESRAQGAPEPTALDARADEIHRLGVLRAVPQSNRAQYGVYVGLDSEGRLDVVRGVIVEGRSVPPQTPSTFGVAASASPPAEVAKPRPPRPAAGSAILPLEARRLAEMAASRAAAQAIQGLAIGDVLRIALAALAAKDRAAVGIERSQGPGGSAGSLLRRLSRMDFCVALAQASESSDEDVEQAFAEAIAGAVDFRHAEFAAGRGLIKFIDRIDVESFAPLYAAGFDYAAYFTVAGRAVSLEAIRACGGPAAESERAWLPDDKLAAEAALLARAKCWLPPFLSGDAP